VNGDADTGNEVCYTGGVYDESTGLYYLNARYYDPEDGRFLTEDTYRGEENDPDTWHLYAYCNNDPVNYKDPSGHIKGTTLAKHKTWEHLSGISGANWYAKYKKGHYFGKSGKPTYKFTKKWKTYQQYIDSIKKSYNAHVKSNKLYNKMLKFKSKKKVKVT